MNLLKYKGILQKNNFVRLIYRTKFYFDLGVSQISWFTGKLPEIMAVVYFFDRSGVYLSLDKLILFSVLVFLSITILGLFLKYSGLWDTECYVNTYRNPVNKEILEAAQLINQRFGTNEKKKTI